MNITDNDMRQYIKNFFGHLKTVCVHKYWVFYYGCKLGIPVRAFFHDFSKFNPIEFFESVKYYQGGKSSPINAAKTDKGYSKAWQHHKGHNPHHYEHWTDKYDDGTVAIKMPWKYVMEMTADYLGAARAYMGKDFSLYGELEWWKRKLSTNPCIHEETKNLMTQLFCTFAVAKTVYNQQNNWVLREGYENNTLFSNENVMSGKVLLNYSGYPFTEFIFQNIDDILSNDYYR